MDAQRNQNQVGDKIYALLGWYAACSGNSLTPGDGIDSRSRNVGKELPLHAALTTQKSADVNYITTEARNVESVINLEQPQHKSTRREVNFAFTRPRANR